MNRPGYLTVDALFWSTTERRSTILFTYLFIYIFASSYYYYYNFMCVFYSVTLNDHFNVCDV